MKARLVALWGQITWTAGDLRARVLGALGRTAVAAGKTGWELATIGLGLAGWGILTHVAVGFLGEIVWEVSLGLLCLSLFGWKLAYVVARDGIYALRQRGKKS